MTVPRSHMHIVIGALLLVWLCSQVALAANTVSITGVAPAYVWQVRNIETAGLGIHNPVGLAFSAKANTFQVVSGHASSQPVPRDTNLFLLTLMGTSAGMVRITAQVEDPINLTFDGKRDRLLIYRAAAGQLIEVAASRDGTLDPNGMKYYKAEYFNIQTPQGMTVDPASGDLYILDAAGPSLVRVTPDTAGGFDNTTIFRIDLQPTGLVQPRGLAWDPTTQHLHLVSPRAQALFEVTTTGHLVATRTLAGFGLRDLQGMVFAPSGDLTDDALQMSLYIADDGLATQPARGSGTRPTTAVAEAQADGTIVELSFAAPPPLAAPSFTASLVRTIDTATISPPSLDPSGLTYLPNSNTLLISDSEVEETVSGISHFQGANVWELSLGGSVVRTANISKVAPTVVPMTNEPSGVAWNLSNGHYYFSDDDKLRVYDLNPGADGLVGTTDDTWTYFSTLAAGNGDPEGITYDSWHNRLFVADGVNMEIYQYTLTGSLVSHFDVEAYGVLDPESVEFNPDSGTLFVLGNHEIPIIVETTTSGSLLETIDISAANTYAPAGLAYAPASDGSGAKRFYIVDRAIDNNDNPNIIDGKIFELTAPSPSTPTSTPTPTATPTSTPTPTATPTSTPPVVNAGPDQTIVLPNSAVLGGTVTDNGLPNPPGAVTTTWSKVGGSGSVTFANASAKSTTATFSATGTYTLRLTASDGELSGSDEVKVLVMRGGGGTTKVWLPVVMTQK
jgi:uncharacterized protein YjiK